MDGQPDCVTCGKALSGRKKRFCCLKCKNIDTNNRHQYYASQQERGLTRKLKLVEEAGGRCTKCGYSRNIAALTWHHVDPRSKRFQLDMRNLSNRNEYQIRVELTKCVLLCANCHAEVHSPSLDTEAIDARGASVGRNRG